MMFVQHFVSRSAIGRLTITWSEHYWSSANQGCMCVKWASLYVCNRIHQTFASLTEHMTLSFNKFTMRKEKRSASHVLETVFHPSATLQSFFPILRALKSNISMKRRKWVVFRQVSPPLFSSPDFLLRYCVFIDVEYLIFIPFYPKYPKWTPSSGQKAASHTRYYERRQRNRRGACFGQKRGRRAAGGGHQIGSERRGEKNTSFPFSIVTIQPWIMASTWIWRSHRDFHQGCI